MPLSRAYQNQAESKPTGLISFCVLLLKTCEYDAAPVFQKLLEHFRADISVDAALFGVSLLSGARCSQIEFCLFRGASIAC